MSTCTCGCCGPVQEKRPVELEARRTPPEQAGSDCGCGCGALGCICGCGTAEHEPEQVAASVPAVEGDSK